MTTDTRRDGGFMMVALLIAMAVVAIWMTAALPKWSHQAQRSKEEELIFRGEQYARAIVLYMNKNRGVPPADFDILVSQHHLRKKWKDPITGCDFVPVGIGVNSNPTNCPKYAQIIKPQTPVTSASPISGQQQPGITGVRSLSTATSIKIYVNQQRHDAWPFDANLMRGRMGGAGGANPQQGGQGGRSGGVDGRGGRGLEPVGGPARGGQLPPGRGGAAGAPGGAPPPPRPIGRGGGGF